MKRLLFILILIIPGSVFSCNQKKWKQTSSGVSYKIFTKDSSKQKPVYGDHIWMHLRKLSPDKKEIFNTRIFDTKNGVEMEYKLPVKITDVTEIFSFMGKGDSAIVRIPANLIDTTGSPKKQYTFFLNLLDFKTKDDYSSQKIEQFKQQLILDSLTIRDYIQNKDLHGCIQDEYGNWFMKKTNGNGKSIQETDSITINYIGKLTNGKEFDNSYERKQPFSFVVGKKQVIDGLDKGIRNFNYGDKGILIIPSRLSYGEREVGKIPTNSVLIFEFEIFE